MFILDKAQIGDSVHINLELSKGRLDKNIIEAIKISPKEVISDFRITDGKGIGVILKLANGKEQWFFEDEIDLIDEKGNIIEKDIINNKNNNLIFNIFKNLRYEKKSKINELLNPINFVIWLTVSLKDIF